MQKLAGKVAIITGSTRGLGEGTARLMAAEGAAVVVSGRNAAEGRQVAESICAAGGEAVFVPADLSDPQACVDLVETAVHKFGKLDVLVNNAAIFPSTPLDEVTAEQWDQVYALNVRAPFLCSRAAIGPMRAQGGGVIINIGSVTAYQTAPILDRLVYGTSKAALLAMTKKMAHGLLADRIRVNWVTVGWIATPGEIALRDGTTGDGQHFLQQIAAQAPLGRLETVEETAAAVLYLATDEAAHVTACELNISGGLHI